jgi:RNA polymerase primary sigma factor
MGGEQGTMGLYLRELGKLPRLSTEEEQACARLAAQGDPQARRRLLQANLRFVVLVAKQYRGRGLPLEDLISEGNIGLIRAAERFDPERGIHFISYAVWWIRQAILKAIQESGRPIRIPRSRIGELSRIEALRREGLMQNGSEPSLGQIAGALVLKEEELARLLQSAQGPLSLDGPAGDRADGEPFGARLEDRSVAKPEEVLAGASLPEELERALARLSDREAGILRNRFGLAGRNRVSLLEAGRKYGLSRERVRQIEKKALRKIRASNAVQQLKIYAN